MGLFDSLRKTFGGKGTAQSPASPVEAVVDAPTEGAALEALGRVISQDDLKRVVEGAWRHNAVRIAALERISDEAFLTSWAIKEQVIPVKMRVIERIASPTRLLEIWKREKGTPAWREVALRAESRAAELIGQLDDQDALAQYAGCESTQCRRAATERIKDKKLLKRVALGGDDIRTDEYQRRIAISKLDDKGVLRKVLERRDPWDDDYKEAEARLAELDEGEE